VRARTELLIEREIPDLDFGYAAAAALDATRRRASAALIAGRGARPVLGQQVNAVFARNSGCSPTSSFRCRISTRSPSRLTATVCPISRNGTE
jgi:hypothetical protein